MRQLTRNLLPVLVVLIGSIVVIALFLSTRSTRATREFSERQFVGMLQSNRLAQIEVIHPAEPAYLQEVRGMFYPVHAGEPVLAERGGPKAIPFKTLVHLTDQLEQKIMEHTNVTIVQHRSLFKILEW